MSKTPASVRRSWEAAVIVLLGVFVTLSAHDGPHKVDVQIRKVQGRAGEYHLAFAMLPQAPVTGQEVQCEVKVLTRTGTDETAGAQATLADRDVTMAIVRDDQAVTLHAHKENTPGVHGAHHRFEAAGAYAVRVTVDDDETITFPVLVRSGPIERTRWVMLALLALAVGGWAVTRWRAADLDPGSRRRVAWYAAGALIAGGLTVYGVAPAVGRAFLPAHEGSIDWSNVDRDHARGAASK